MSREEAAVKIQKLKVVLKHGKNIDPVIRTRFEVELKRLQSKFKVFA